MILSTTKNWNRFFKSKEVFLGAGPVKKLAELNRVNMSTDVEGQHDKTPVEISVGFRAQSYKTVTVTC